MGGSANSNVKSFELSLFADYFQFYVQDETATGDLSQAWSEEATDRLLAIAPGTIGIGTARNMDVPVTLEIHDREPSDNFAEWDYVVESSLEVTSGRIVIAGCTEYFPDAMRVPVQEGIYRVRVCYRGLDTLSADGLDGDDHYRVQLWLAAPTGFRTLKRRLK